MPVHRITVILLLLNNCVPLHCVPRDIQLVESWSKDSSVKLFLVMLTSCVRVSEATRACQTTDRLRRIAGIERVSTFPEF